VQDEIDNLASEAIRKAADRLGVDPYRLARFLAHGRIADFLQGLGRAETLEIEKQQSELLTDRFAAFLREERRLEPDSDAAKKKS
jgi:hypothetical protein